MGGVCGLDGDAPVLNTLNRPPPVERAKVSPLGLKPQRPVAQNRQRAMKNMQRA
jgi:hypothetical protein